MDIVIKNFWYSLTGYSNNDRHRDYQVQPDGDERAARCAQPGEGEAVPGG